MRLNKYLSQAGVASRRGADKLITQGVVKVNHQTATLGQSVEPDDDLVTVNKRVIELKTNYVYYLLHKPKNVVSTVSDDRGRPTVLDYVKLPIRIYPVGRLDFESTGLILLTNDGDLTLRLTHPRYQLPKIYLVDINRPVSPIDIKKIASGVYLDDQKTLPLKIVPNKGSDTNFIITLYQGLNRHIRRVFELFDYQVVRLHRIAIGPLILGNLRPGESRPLTPAEVKMLKTY